MGARQYYLIENRVVYSEFDDTLNILSRPHKSIKYFFVFILYLIGIAILTFLVLIPWKTDLNFESFLFKKGYIIKTWMLVILYLGICVSYFLYALPLIYSVFKHTLINNLFLSEELVITKDLISLKKFNRKIYSFQLQDIKEISFHTKRRDLYSGYTWLIPNYEKTITFKSKTSSKEIDFFKTIKENEIKFIYDSLREKLNINGVVFKETKYQNIKYLRPE